MICYRYYSWSQQSALVESQLIKDIESLEGHIQYRNDCVDLWIPKDRQWFIYLRYPELVRQQNLDY